MGNCCKRERDAFDEDASLERISFEKGELRTQAPEEAAAKAIALPKEKELEKEKEKEEQKKAASMTAVEHGEIIPGTEKGGEAYIGDDGEQPTL